jgi:LacI family transcriptional regulator
MDMRGKVTIQEIADMAGVSKFAVSRALTGKSGVSSQTREMIIKVAGQLGYFKNEPKRLAFAAEITDQYNGSGTILVLFPNIRYQNTDSLYWGPVFDGISTRLNQKGLDILTLTEPTGDSMFSLVNPDAIRGIITVGTISTTILLEINRLGIPIVMVDHLDPAFRCDTVFTDNLTCMKEIMMKLFAKGYRKFQFVGNIGDAHSYHERWIAYRAALEEQGLGQENKQISILVSPEMEHTYDSVYALNPEDIPEVFVCVNDTTALFAMEALEAKGIKVPEHCALTGFDNTHESLPLLATVNVNKELLGMRAVDQMLWRISNPLSAYEKKLIFADLIIRETNALKVSDTSETSGSNL